MLLKGPSVDVLQLMKPKVKINMNVKMKLGMKRCLPTVASSKFSSTMSSLRTSRMSNPRGNSPQVKRVQLTLIPGTYKVHRFSEFTSLYSYCDALPPNSAKSWQSKKFKKHSHPLFLIVSSPVLMFLQSCCEP